MANIPVNGEGLRASLPVPPAGGPEMARVLADVAAIAPELARILADIPARARRGLARLRVSWLLRARGEQGKGRAAGQGERENRVVPSDSHVFPPEEETRERRECCAAGAHRRPEKKGG